MNAINTGDIVQFKDNMEFRKLDKGPHRIACMWFDDITERHYVKLVNHINYSFSKERFELAHTLNWTNDKQLHNPEKDVFYMIKNITNPTSATTVMHATFFGAHIEAIRLARANPTCKFVILKSDTLISVDQAPIVERQF